LARLCSWSEVHTLVADDDLDAKWRAQVAETGVQLILANTVASPSPPMNPHLDNIHEEP